MRRLTFVAVVVLFLSGSVSAQERSPKDVFLEHYWRELAFREFEHKRSNVDREIASRRHAEYLEMQFIAKVNRFAALWAAMVQEYNEKKVFNIKIAAEVTKAFHEIEISGGWLKRSAGNKGNIR